MAAKRASIWASPTPGARSEGRNAALLSRADPLHLAAVFHFSSSTAIAYADIARSLLERPVEGSWPSPLDQ